jgi:predicted RecB family nuclease
VRTTPGLPPHWTFAGPKRSALRQICLATPPSLARVVAAAVHTALDLSDDPLPPVLLGAYAAGQCPRAIHNRFDRTVVAPAWTVPAELQLRFDHGNAFEQQVITDLLDDAAGDVVDLRAHRDNPVEHVAETVRHLNRGVQVIVGGRLPADPIGGRTGLPDLLVRGSDRPDGSPGYHPVDIKWHKTRDARHATSVRVSVLSTPSPNASRAVEGEAARQRTSDLLQLSHYWRMLEAAGREAQAAHAGIVGTDDVDGSRVITWYDLAVSTLRGAGHRATSTTTPLERYDDEQALRLQVAAVARRRSGQPDDPSPLVQPVGQKECATCQWAASCVETLPADDLSRELRNTLTVPEYMALRDAGVTTVTELATADVNSLIGGDSGQGTAPIPIGRSRLDRAVARARLARDGLVLRPAPADDFGPPIPSGNVEFDLDIEWSREGFVYLWGILKSDGDKTEYQSFFDASVACAEAESRLALTAMSWLARETRKITGQGRSSIVFHYAPVERTYADRIRDRDAPRWDREIADADMSTWIDLLPFARQRVVSRYGHGLKILAVHGPGFAWRDDDPGGLQSQVWLEAARQGPPEERAATVHRLLTYNEDDVRATLALRRWLRSLG